MKIKVGDRVRVKDKTLATYGLQGIVVSIDDWIRVSLDTMYLGHYEGKYFEEELEAV